MLQQLLSVLFGTRHEREVKRVQPLVAAINAEYERLHGVSERELQAQTEKLRAIVKERTSDLDGQIAALKEKKKLTADPQARQALDDEISGADGRGGLEGEVRDVLADVLEEILPEAFATVREAARRLVGTVPQVTGHEIPWNMVHYDVQLIGGIQLHRGRIAEMATGEGKTLVATLPLYLNALAGRGAHLVTVNSYLARRDSQWMGHLYKYLGLSVGCIDDTEPGTPERRAGYQCDITYGTNNEFGFDYLRDNMVTSLEQRVQRPHFYAIVDEVDSVLIDEARTPLIISGAVGDEGDAQYRDFNNAVSRLVRAQTEDANRLVGEAEQALARGDEREAAMRLYQAQLGAPKNKKLVKMLQETGVKALVQRMELDHIADRKQPSAKQVYRDLEERLLFVLDERGHTVHLTDRGVDYISPSDHDAFVLPDIAEAVHRIDRDPALSPADKLAKHAEIERAFAQKSDKLTIVHQLLRAHALYEKDVNYVVQEGQVLIVDEFTGRTMPGRRWAEGLHQAVEAKEGVTVKGETQTLATITIQNYFRMYEKLAGMTGTAETEETEFHDIYGLDVAVIPTNQPVVRDDRQDLIYKTRREKYAAILEEVDRLHKLGYPVLVGTVNVDVSETLSKVFQRAGLRHNVLNAKNHQREAEIVAEAGQAGSVTIATNMAGRGTDIKLGSGVTETRPSQVKDPEGTLVDVEECGGLHIIGSERHEARRIDRQLRGRAGRQGDPGASQFFLSLEDDLMRLFGSERIAKLMDRMGAQEGEHLTHPLITRSIGQAQKRVELQNFQSRKRLLEYDDVMNQQREVIYSLRAFALEGGEELKGEARKMIAQAMERRVEQGLANYEKDEEWDLALLRQDLLMHYLLTVPEFDEAFADRPRVLADAQAFAVTAGNTAFDNKLKTLGDFKDQLLALVMLNVLDEKWKDHLYDLDQLRASINFRAWGQKDPLIEYKQEAYSMFVDLMGDIFHAFAERFLRVQVVFEPPPGSTAARRPGPAGPAWTPTRTDPFGMRETGDGGALDIGPGEPPSGRPAVRAEPRIVGAGRVKSLDQGKGGMPQDWSNVGRNDPCPCGSGKKFKKCHGASI